MQYQLNISNQDLKRLKVPSTDFIIICNKTTRLCLKQFISSNLSKENPEHEIEIIHPELVIENAGTYKNIQSSISKLIVKGKPDGKPKLYIIQFELNSLHKLKDITTLIWFIKIEIAITKKIFKEEWPVLLIKFATYKKTYFNTTKNSLSPRLQTNSHSGNKTHTYTLRVSHPVTTSELEGFKSSTETKKYLLSRLNAMELPHSEKNIIKFNSILKHKTVHEELIAEIPTEKIKQEINKLPRPNRLLNFKQFEIYLAEFHQIPNTMLEIGRLRELTFRKVKEGTGYSLDLDSFDSYYLHLFIWDTEKEKIAGAYRLAEGHKIIPLLGKKGFYISTLFKINNEFINVLIQSVELGRSFIIPQYQKSNYLLILMWKALYTYIFSNPKNRYIFGPVSISEEYSKISRLLIMDYLKKFYGHHEFEKWVRPRKPFRLIRNSSSGNIILRNFEKDIHKLDKLISEIQYNAFKLPVLLRQYLKQNAKVIAFNKDPIFHNVLDALLILDHENMSGELTELLQKEISVT